MMINKPVFYLVFCVSLTACFNFEQMSQQKKTVKEDSIMLLDIKGIINNELAENFMKYVRDYAGEEKIKGVLVRVDSPGGAVGASQEINSAIREVREFYKKPVFVSGGDLVASGGVYSIMSADKIFVNRGALFGSIGVLTRVQDYSELIEWAKMEIYNLKAGEFKDIKSVYRKMTLRERELLENLLENSLEQFKEAIISGRKLDPKLVESFSDGRIFSGAEALEFGLVDSLGSFNQAIRAIGEKTGLGSHPTLFEPGAKSPYESFFENFAEKSMLFEKLFSTFIKFNKLSGRPLYILPSYTPSP